MKMLSSVPFWNRNKIDMDSWKVFKNFAVKEAFLHMLSYQNFTQRSQSFHVSCIGKVHTHNANMQNC